MRNFEITKHHPILGPICSALFIEPIQMVAWRLRDEADHIFVFPNLVMQPSKVITRILQFSGQS